MFKRIGLLVLANLAVFIMLSVILTVVQMVFGVNFGTCLLYTSDAADD